MSTSASFPIVRVQLPTLSLSKLEQRALKRMITRMLQHTVREFDQHIHANGGVVDTSRWKALVSRDDVRVFREREAGALSAALAFALDKTDVLPRGSTVAPLTPPGVLMTGSTRGNVENVMDAVSSTSQQDLALELSFMLHEDVVDCAVLHTIEAPTETDPFHFLGIKYCVRKASGPGMKHQDAVYLEFTGYTETTRGERLGFHLMHSLELAEFPLLTARNSVRTLQSVRYLYRQQSEDVVAVFMLGNVDIPGKLTASDALFGLATVVACAEAKRLTQMWRAQQARNNRQEHRKQQSRRASTALECSMCRQKKKLFGGASLAACELCAQIICSRCHTDKKVFETDANGILGRFRKVSACKCCVLAANKPLSQGLIIMSEHMQLDREDSRDRRRHGASSSNSSGPRSRSDSSCPSASSEECSTAPQAHCGGRKNESVASTASTGSSRSYREGLGLVVRASPMGMSARAHGGQLVYTISDQQAALQQQQQQRANAVKSSRGIDRGNEQQLTLREHHRMPFQLPNAPQSRHQQLSLVSRSHRDYALRRVASTGSTLSSSSYNYGTAPSSQPTDLLARMVELNRVAESTYNTTQQNGIYLSQQLRTRRKT